MIRFFFLAVTNYNVKDSTATNKKQNKNMVDVLFLSKYRDIGLLIVCARDQQNKCQKYDEPEKGRSASLLLAC